MAQNHDPAPIETFRAIFRAEHREIRDGFLALYDAFGAGNKRAVTSAFKKLGALCGPHFRYEEEALYPAVKPIYGKIFVEHMFREHDHAIIDALQLAKIVDKRGLSEADAKRGQKLVRRMLPHVSDCEGLSIMVELLPDADVQEILDARERAQRENDPLFEWALGVRGRSFQLTFEQQLNATRRQARGNR